MTDTPVLTQLQKTATVPLIPLVRPKKRIIVLCDGTWQDGTIVRERWRYTNILKLSRMITHLDERTDPPIHQVVYYQTGIGSENNLYSKYVQGATGASLGEKVQEAYAFIAQNYASGDEIFLFGFSRGAYTARMVAMFIGHVGVLNRVDMDHFADIFIASQKLSKTKDEDEIAKLEAQLAPWTSHDAPGKKRCDSDDHSFSVKCVGVFDTVGATGLPEEVTRHAPHVTALFGFPDTFLGEHIERAYQCLALNEVRADFNCAKFVQTEGGRNKGQILKQCWFAGEHSDIGGGWQDHDLSDITLTWMAANIGDMLALDLRYLASLFDPVAPWGKQPPHDSRTGIFVLADTVKRQLPTQDNEVTHETIHPSVLEQEQILPQLQQNIDKCPSLVCGLLPLEEQVKKNWPYVPGKHDLKQSKGASQVQNVPATRPDTLESTASDVWSFGRELGQHLLKEFSPQAQSDANSSSSRSFLHTLAHESNIGAILKELAN